MLSANECNTYKEFTDKHQRSLYFPLAQKVLRHIEGRPAPTIMDLGTGPGHLTCELAKRTTGRIHSVDINPSMHTIARQVLSCTQAVAEVDFVLADVHALPFDDQTHDLIISYTCYHHYANPVRALQECLRVLKPNGCLVLIDTMPISPDTLDSIRNELADERFFAIVAKAYREAIAPEVLKSHLLAAEIRTYDLQPYSITLEEWMDCLDDIEPSEFASQPKNESTMWIATIRKETP